MKQAKTRKRVTKVMVHNLPVKVVAFLSKRAVDRGHSSAASAVCRAAIMDYVGQTQAREAIAGPVVYAE